MGDLSKNFSKLEVQCPCSCGADKISSILIEKLQKVRNIIGRPIIITSGVCCEFYNALKFFEFLTQKNNKEVVAKIEIVVQLNKKPINSFGSFSAFVVYG